MWERIQKEHVLVLYLVIVIWLSEYYFVADGWWHRLHFWLLVVPTLWLHRDTLRSTVQLSRSMMWVYGLVVYQGISHSWATPSDTNYFFVGGDLIGVSLLSTAIFLAGTKFRITAILQPVMRIGAFWTLVSLLAYYSTHSLASRFWFPFIYENGLNPVLTGFICGFSVLIAGHQIAIEEGQHKIWPSIALVVTLMGLLATQSRGPWLACIVGWLFLLVLERRRMLLPTLIAGVVALSYVGLLQMASQDGASTTLVSRGATGRFEIYQAYFEGMQSVHWFIGRGWGAVSTLPEEQLGWLVHHPHSAYMTQFFLTGALGLIVLLGILMQGLANGVYVFKKENDSLGGVLLVAGMMAVLFDGSQIFALGSVARVEFLLVAVPLLLLAGARTQCEIEQTASGQLE